MKNVIKLFLSLILSVALIFTMMPISAFAADEDEKSFKVAGDEINILDQLPDSDELFKDYVNKALYEDVSRGISLFGVTAGNRFEEGSLTKKAYNILKKQIGEIARGKRKEAIIGVPCSITLTREEVGSDLINNGAISKEAKAKIEKKVASKISFTKLLNALLADCPYDLYWFDKTQGLNWYYQISSTSEVMEIKEIVFEFNVSSSYKVKGKDYYVDTNKTGATTKAVANARKIVDKYAGKSDKEKLALYRDEICNLVSYNHDAVNSSQGIAYGDPWQMIYVFDGNPRTNVVCEGYAKAFQYLCDISNFKDDITCFSVMGNMETIDGFGGPHMWNVVKVNKQNYLVDVTNCDEGAIGYPNKLHMVNAKSSAKYHKIHNVNGIKYEYDESEKNLNCGGYLCICKDIQAHSHVSSKWIVSKKATTKVNGYKYKKCIDCDKRLSSKTIPYIKSTYLSASTYTYNGKIKTPSVKVKDAKGNTLEKNIDYTVSYAKGRKYVGKYKVKVTFKGDYRGTKTLYFKINPKSTTISTLKPYKKSFKAYWKKQTTQIKGYQLRYSTSSKMKNNKTLTINGYKNTSKTVKKLRAKSKYYVQVRVYKKTSSGTYYSSWSKVKSVRTR